MTRVYLSIGSNIDCEKNIRSSIRRLADLHDPLTLSSVYQSRAMGFDGADFYNMAVGFDTASRVDDVYAGLREIEDCHGRLRSVEKFSSRPLDIDLLLFGDLVRHSAGMDIPRGEILQYAFVLLPLSEIAAGFMHPETGITIGRMWQEFNAVDQAIEKIAFDFDGVG